MSITPDSVISSIRSVPSRVRSPTPAKTETPPCCCARLWISSWMSTVLPTPAPPKRPTLPPLMYGAIRSTHLRPVSKISIFGERSRKAGGSRWIGQRSASAASAALLVDRLADHVPEAAERRLRRRARRSGAPVSTTSTPRASPSVESIATARTRSSPRCCCTSATSVPLGELDLEGGQDLGKALREDGVDHDALDLDDLAQVATGRARFSGMWLRWACRWTERRPHGRPATESTEAKSAPGRSPVGVMSSRSSSASTRSAWSRRQTSDVTKLGVTITPPSVRAAAPGASEDP